MYKGVQYVRTGAFTPGNVIVEKIPVRNPRSGILSIFVKLSSGALTSLEVYESIDGVDWQNATALAAYESSTDWAVISFKGITNYPTGTILQLRCVAAGVTVEDIQVVQDW